MGRKQLLDMRVQPVSFQHSGFKVSGPRDDLQTPIGPTGTAEWLYHIPFGAGIVKGQFVADRQGLMTRDPNFEPGHVEFQ